MTASSPEANARHDVPWALLCLTWLAPSVDVLLGVRRCRWPLLLTGPGTLWTAFLSAYGGEVELIEIQVTAVTDGPLPDDVTALVSIG